MCGIAGIVCAEAGAPVDRDVLGRMARTLAHRGPDDEGLFVAPGIGLASRRLAVQDPTERGHQPMATPGGRFVLVFNGEIYNFQDLRRELTAAGVAFRSGADTEVLLHLLAREGEAGIEKLRGMFAFAFWDAERRRLLLARDRLGKKPLVYTRTRERLTFASEAKAVVQDPGVERAADLDALQHYLTFGYVPAPRSAFRGLCQLPPGHLLTVSGGELREQRYWTLRATPQRREPRAALVEELRSTLVEATRLRMVSDVPVGVLLSGGVDSSAVAAAVRQCTSGPVRTFTVGFDDERHDERPAAAAVARHLGTDHVELVVRPDADRMLPALAWHYDQPLADSSALPTLAIAAEARRHVTVALGGDGGDETFLGYERYLASRVLGAADRLPAGLRRVVAAGAPLLPAGPPRSRTYRARRLLMAASETPRRRYAGFMTVFDDEARTRICTPAFLGAAAGRSPLALLDEAFDASDAPTFVEAAAYTDLTMYLPGALMTKMDIGSMAHGLEVRSPLLDHTLVEFAVSVPAAHRLDGLTQKVLLKQAVRPWLPAGALDRPKAGFNVPLDRWLRGPLGEAARETLLSARAVGRGLFDRAEVARLVDEHASGRHHRHARIWSLLVLEWWHRTWIDGPPALEPPRLPAADAREPARP